MKCVWHGRADAMCNVLKLPRIIQVGVFGVCTCICRAGCRSDLVEQSSFAGVRGRRAATQAPPRPKVVTESACTDANECSVAIVELGGAYACDNSTNGTIPTPSSNATHTLLLLATCNTSSGFMSSWYVTGILVHCVLRQGGLQPKLTEKDAVYRDFSSS